MPKPGSHNDACATAVDGICHCDCHGRQHGATHLAKARKSLKDITARKLPGKGGYEVRMPDGFPPGGGTKEERRAVRAAQVDAKGTTGKGIARHPRAVDNPGTGKGAVTDAPKASSVGQDYLKSQGIEPGSPVAVSGSKDDYVFLALDVATGKANLQNLNTRKQVFEPAGALSKRPLSMLDPEPLPKGIQAKPTHGQDHLDHNGIKVGDTVELVNRPGKFTLEGFEGNKPVLRQQSSGGLVRMPGATHILPPSYAKGAAKPAAKPAAPAGAGNATGALDQLKAAGFTVGKAESADKTSTRHPISRNGYTGYVTVSPTGRVKDMRVNDGNGKLVGTAKSPEDLGRLLAHVGKSDAGTLPPSKHAPVPGGNETDTVTNLRQTAKGSRRDAVQNAVDLAARSKGKAMLAHEAKAGDKVLIANSHKPGDHSERTVIGVNAGGSVTLDKGQLPREAVIVNVGRADNVVPIKGAKPSASKGLMTDAELAAIDNGVAELPARIRKAGLDYAAAIREGAPHEKQKELSLNLIRAMDDAKVKNWNLEDAMGKVTLRFRAAHHTGPVYRDDAVTIIDDLRAANGNLNSVDRDQLSSIVSDLYKGRSITDLKARVADRNWRLRDYDLTQKVKKVIAGLENDGEGE